MEKQRKVAGYLKLNDISTLGLFYTPAVWTQPGFSAMGDGGSNGHKVLTVAGVSSDDLNVNSALPAK